MKGNQPTLRAALEQMVQHTLPIDTFTQTERSRGRSMAWYVAVYECVSPADAASADAASADAASTAVPRVDPAWQARQMVYVVRSGTREDRPYQRDSYYLTSRCDTAAGFAAGIRAHWGVENGLHWVKDALMNEDRSRIRSMKAATALSLLKGAVLTRYRRAGYTSIKTATVQFANKIDALYRLLRT